MNRGALLPILVTTASMLWLQSCALAPPVSPPLAVAVPSAEPRRDAIMRQIREVCPQPMTAGELATAADFVEAHPDALPLVKRLDLFDRQSRICRGMKP